MSLNSFPLIDQILTLGDWAMPRVLHLDMPRAFTTTLKTFDFRTAAALQHNSVFFDQADLNSDFWAFAIRKIVPDLELSHFFAPHVSPEIVAKFVHFLSVMRDDYDLPLTPSGFHFGELADSTSHIGQAISVPVWHDLVNGYLDRILPLIRLEDDALRVVSLGVDSANSLFFACAFARALRGRLSKNIKLILGKHSYENFSLALRKDQIQRSGRLAEFFDDVVYHEEQFAASLFDSCHGKNEFKLADADSDSAPSFLIDRSVYMQALSMPASHYVCSMPLSRNKCYWKKCTFCVQIKKHLADESYPESGELASALDEITCLQEKGFRYFLFNDEAVPPAKLRRLCDFLEASQIDVKWTVRMIADADIKEELIARMAATGCFEVLIGLESVSPQTSARMGKVSYNEDEIALSRMLKRFSEQGIHLFLTFIYGFPTESTEEFERTSAFAGHLQDNVPRIAVRFNKFHLFFGSDVYLAPDAFELRFVQADEPEADLRLVFEYEDKFGRRYSDSPDQRYFLTSIKMQPEAFAELIESKGYLYFASMFQINYASFGLLYKAQTSRKLLEILA